MTESTATLDSGIELCYETAGDPSDPTILLVMGLGGPMGWWHPDFVADLVGRGFHVVRFDNRDTGRSSRVPGHRPVRRSSLVRSVLARPSVRPSVPPYTLSDMADDAVGLLDHLEVAAAHVVGISMGGMIAQTMALEHRDRMRSLTSLMSTTGRRTVGWQSPRLLPMLLGRGAMDRDAYVARSELTVAAIGSPGYPRDSAAERRRAEETFDRGWSAAGVARQMLAVVAQTDRTEQLRSLQDLPTLVVHGLADRMVHVSGGRATAAAIPGAELVLLPGMGHDVPTALHDTICSAIARVAHRADSRAASAR